MDDGAAPADSMLNELRAAVLAKHVGCQVSLPTSETASVSLETCRWLPLDTFRRTELGDIDSSKSK
jgi:hypothetical protein